MSQSFDVAALLEINALPEYLARVEARMDDALSGDDSTMSKAVLRLSRARGKRLRPTLVIASALLAGDINEAAIKAAAAVELIHIGSLIHDDIIDKASTRWNIPTINAKEGLDYAILGGDLLFAKACALAAEASQEAGIIAAETIALLCSGQSAELAVQYDLKRTEAQLERAAYGKTAALLAAACEMGGICTNQSEDKLEALSRFGGDFGMGFQLVDDVLDLVSSDELMGKPVGNDVKEGVYALPIILSLQGPERVSVEKELAKTGSHKTLVETLLKNGSIEKAIARTETYNRTAAQTLDAVYGEAAHNLAQLPSMYLDWVLSSLISDNYRAKIKRLA